ncbi:hypothetical protein Dimus_007333 [Dionaea muscipula]
MPTIAACVADGYYLFLRNSDVVGETLNLEFDHIVNGRRDGCVNFYFPNVIPNTFDSVFLKLYHLTQVTPNSYESRRVPRVHEYPKHESRTSLPNEPRVLTDHGSNEWNRRSSHRCLSSGAWFDEIEGLKGSQTCVIFKRGYRASIQPSVANTSTFDNGYISGGDDRDPFLLQMWPSPTAIPCDLSVVFSELHDEDMHLRWSSRAALEWRPRLPSLKRSAKGQFWPIDLLGEDALLGEEGELVGGPETCPVDLPGVEGDDQEPGEEEMLGGPGIYPADLPDVGVMCLMRVCPVEERGAARRWENLPDECDLLGKDRSLRPNRVGFVPV